MKQNPYTTFYIVRHGETEWNVQGILQGHNDSKLTEKGMMQAAALKEKLQQVMFDAVFSSDLLRAKRTAEIITLDKKLAITTTKLLRERAFGKWEGKPYSIFTNELQHLLKEFTNLSDAQKATYKYPDMETDEEIMIRFITFLRETAAAYPLKTILVVTHGGMMRSLLIHLGFGTHDSLSHNAISNSAYFQLQSDGIEFKVTETSGITKQPTTTHENVDLPY